ADGMIADGNGHMPDDLKHGPDAHFFREGLDSAALVVHGRHSHEQQGPISDRRRRLVVTDRTPGLSAHSSIGGRPLGEDSALQVERIAVAGDGSRPPSPWRWF